MHIARKELSDEVNEELSMKIKAIDINKIVEVTYYDGDKYTRVEGKVNKIDKLNRRIIIDSKEINLFDVIGIEIV